MKANVISFHFITGMYVSVQLVKIFICLELGSEGEDKSPIELKIGHIAWSLLGFNLKLLPTHFFINLHIAQYFNHATRYTYIKNILGAFVE